MRVHSILEGHGSFDVFAKYGVDIYLSSFGIYVPKKSKHMAKTCNIKLRHGFFTSNISNKIADNLGYITDVELRYNYERVNVLQDAIDAKIYFLSFKEIQRIDPSLQFEHIESDKAALRTWIFEDL